jgi:hypothetical protein
MGPALESRSRDDLLELLAIPFSRKKGSGFSQLWGFLNSELDPSDTVSWEFNSRLLEA